MKAIVKLAILVATLLLVTNMAFAAPDQIICDLESCYDATVTDENGQTYYDNYSVCLNEDGHGYLTSNLANTTYDLYVFGGGPVSFNFDPGVSTLNWTTWIVTGESASGYIWTSADGIYLNGEGHNNGTRYISKGIQVPCEPVFSDERYKKEIQPLESSLDNVMQLRGVSYSWRTEEYKGKGFKEGRQIGLIAQEVERIYPELVTTDGNGYKAVFYNKLVPVLIEAVKEQQQEIKKKDVRIERLERSFEIMEKRIAAIESPTSTLVQ